MSNDEKMLFVLGACALVAVVIFQRKVAPEPAPPNPMALVGVSSTPDNSDMANGPSFLTYNIPWLFAPAIGNVVPSVSMGQIGQVGKRISNFVISALRPDKMEEA